jgi:hypothetical protein
MTCAAGFACNVQCHSQNHGPSVQHFDAVLQALADGFSPTDERHELTPFFPQIAEELLKVAYSDVPLDHAATLHVTAFEAMHTLVANSAQESIELVTKLVPHFLNLIGETLAVVDGDKALLRKRNELQGQLCAALQACPT